MREPPTVMTSRDAARLVGVGRAAWMVESGRWQRPAKGVVVRHSGSLTYDELLQCELLAQSPRAVLGGLTAAGLDGLENQPSASIVIVVPASATPRRRDGVVVKRSRQLEPIDIHPVKRPRRTRIERSVVDAAAWASGDLRAQAIIAASVQQGLVTPQALEAVVNRLTKLRRRALITETIRDVAGGSLSEYEVLFVRMCRRFGLPLPTRQRRRRDPSGRWRYLDADYDEYLLVVEIDGQHHMDVLPWWDDMRRSNEIVVEDGKCVLRFPGFALRREPEQVAETLRRFFATRSPLASA